jgi:hypothetical protein
VDAHDVEVIDAMRRYGGGFVKALAEAAARADDENLGRLKAAWPEYWERYSEMAKQRPAVEAP